MAATWRHPQEKPQATAPPTVPEATPTTLTHVQPAAAQPAAAQPAAQPPAPAAVEHAAKAVEAVEAGSALDQDVKPRVAAGNNETAKEMVGARVEGEGDTASQSNAVPSTRNVNPVESSRSSDHQPMPATSEERGQGSCIDNGSLCPLDIIATAAEVEEHQDGTVVESPSYAAAAAAARTLQGTGGPSSLLARELPSQGRRRQNPKRYENGLEDETCAHALRPASCFPHTPSCARVTPLLPTVWVMAGCCTHVGTTSVVVSQNNPTPQLAQAACGAGANEDGQQQGPSRAAFARPLGHQRVAARGARGHARDEPPAGRRQQHAERVRQPASFIEPFPLPVRDWERLTPFTHHPCVTRASGTARTAPRRYVFVDVQILAAEVVHHLDIFFSLATVNTDPTIHVAVVASRLKRILAMMRKFPDEHYALQVWLLSAPRQLPALLTPVFARLLEALLTPHALRVLFPSSSAEHAQGGGVRHGG